MRPFRRRAGQTSGGRARPRIGAAGLGMLLLLALLLVAGSVLAVDRIRAGARTDLDGVVSFAALGDGLQRYEDVAEQAVASPQAWQADASQLGTLLLGVRTGDQSGRLGGPALRSRYQAVVDAQRQLDAAAADGVPWSAAVSTFLAAERELRSAVAEEERRRLSRARGALRQADRMAGLTHGGTMLVLLLFGAALVVGDRRASAARMAASAAEHRRLQAILDQSPAAFHLTDLSGRYTLVNRAWEHATGWARERVLGRPWEQVWPPVMAAELRARSERVLSSRQPEEVMAPGPTGDGRLFLESRFLLVDEQGRPAAVGGVATDVSDQLAAQEQQRLLAAVVTSATDAILTVQDGVVTSWNRRPGRCSVCPTARERCGCRILPPQTGRKRSRACWNGRAPLRSWPTRARWSTPRDTTCRSPSR